MSKLFTGVRRPEPAGRGAIVIVDEDKPSGAAVRDRMTAEFGETHEVFLAGDTQEAASLLTALRGEEYRDIPVVAVAVHGVLDEPLHLPMGEQADPATRIIAYTDRPLERVRQSAIKAGAITCVPVDDLEPSIQGVLLEAELGQLGASAPIAARVINTIDVGISIQNPQMDVLWANDRTVSIVDGSDAAQRTCWKRYHKFYNRQVPCTDCTAWRVLTSAAHQATVEPFVGNGVLTDYHLLPIEGRIGRVEVNAAPLMSHDGRKVLAVMEATRFVTDEWEQTTVAHERLHDVIATARALGRESAQAGPFAAVAVYYQPDDSRELHLFDAAAEDCDTVPKLLRLENCPAAYREALEDRQPRFFENEAGGKTRRHFLWADRTASMETYVLVDVVYADDKPEGLFTGDLRPYWEYVITWFEAARGTREKAFERAADSFLETFLARTANGVRDEADLDATLQEAVNCVEKALRPLSMHIRILDRKSSTLVNRAGFGPYFGMAAENRLLEYEGIGSSWAASTRRPIWNEHAKLEYIRRCLGRELTPAEEAEVQRIASDVLLPLVWMDRVLGTLCIQFEDDSLFSPAKRRFVKAMAGALGNVLGSREWSRERTAIVKYSKDLDKTMFRRSEHPEEEENNLLAQVTRMVFELTAAEVVGYYRYDPQNRKLTLAAGATQGALPPDAALPEVLRPDLDVASLAAAQRQGHLIHDYRGDACQGMRRRLLASFPRGPENKLCEWLGSEIAEPVIAGDTVQGVLVAMSSIPGWLGRDDREVVREFAFKTGLCLEAKQLMRKLNWGLRTKISLNDITARMARTSDVDTLYRLFLLAITANECLGFSRAILFLRRNGEENKFSAKEVVGARWRSAAETQWKEAEAMPFEDKMKACAQPPQTRTGDLGELVSQLVLDLRQHPEILHSFKARKMAVRRRGQPHIVHEGQLRDMLSPEGNQDCEYALAPLTVGGEMTGAVLADRAFLEATDIAPERLDLLQLLSGEFALMLQAVELRGKEQESHIAEGLALGVTYCLGSQVGLLHGPLFRLKPAPEKLRADRIAVMEKCVRFLQKTSDQCTDLLKFKRVGPDAGKVFDLNEVVKGTIEVVDDPRIGSRLVDQPLRICADRVRIANVVLEILSNACHFADKERGNIWVTTSLEGCMARLDIRDNGPGIDPNFRPDLFQPFKCHPKNRRGLGLSYAKAVTEAYEGKVEEIGKPGEGAHFYVELALVEGEPR